MVRAHGGDIYPFDRDIMDFSVNTNPLGIRQEIRDAAISAIGDMDKYPDTGQRKLRQAIGKMEGVEPGHIICGNGASEIIFGIAAALKPKKTLLISPSFTEYEIAVDSVKSEKVFYSLKEENDFDVGEDILSKIDDSLNLLFICNPNNPTGRMIGKGLLIKVIEKCRENGVRLIVDESFMEFSDKYAECTLTAEAAKYDNLIILKSFTKMYSFPGLRLGYGITNDEGLIDKLKKSRQPWAISNIAESVGMAACALTEHPGNTRSFIKRERPKLCLKLGNLADKGIRYIESEADYILFNAPDVHGERLYELLIKRDILIRDCSDFRGLDGNWYRIAVNSESANNKLISALQDIYGD